MVAADLSSKLKCLGERCGWESAFDWQTLFAEVVSSWIGAVGWPSSTHIEEDCFRSPKSFPVNHLCVFGHRRAVTGHGR